MLDFETFKTLKESFRKPSRKALLTEYAIRNGICTWRTVSIKDQQMAPLAKRQMSMLSETNVNGASHTNAKISKLLLSW